MNKDSHLIHLEIIRSLEVAAHGIADFLLFASRDTWPLYLAAGL